MTETSPGYRLRAVPLTGAEVMATLDQMRSDPTRIPRYPDGAEKPFSIRQIRHQCGRGTLATIDKWRRRYYVALTESQHGRTDAKAVGSTSASSARERPSADPVSVAALQQRLRDLEAENVRLKCALADLILGKIAMKEVTTQLEART